MGCGPYCFNSTVQMDTLRPRAIRTELTELTKSWSWYLNPAFLRQSYWHIASKEDRTPFPQAWSRYSPYIYFYWRSRTWWIQIMFVHGLISEATPDVFLLLLLLFLCGKGTKSSSLRGGEWDCETYSVNAILKRGKVSGTGRLQWPQSLLSFLRGISFLRARHGGFEKNDILLL